MVSVIFGAGTIHQHRSLGPSPKGPMGPLGPTDPKEPLGPTGLGPQAPHQGNHGHPPWDPMGNPQRQVTVGMASCSGSRGQRTRGRVQGTVGREQGAKARGKEASGKRVRAD